MDKDLLIVLGQNIRTAREARHWTKERLAAKAGITYGALHSYEFGARAMPLEKLVSLSKALGVSIAYLLGQGGSEEYSAGFRDGFIAAQRRAVHEITSLPVPHAEPEAAGAPV